MMGKKSDLISEQEVEQTFRAAGAMLEGHFQLTSGRHSAVYLEKFQVLQWPRHTEPLCKAIADHYAESGVQVVVGPTTGGVLLAYEVARRLGVRSIFAESVPGGTGRELRRGFSIAKGERVLIVDDILTTGTSLREVIAAIALYQPDLVGIGILCDRSGGALEKEFTIPYLALLHLDIPTYSPAKCPLCQAGLPLTKPGSRVTAPHQL